jgi:aminoglycoside phosphotransferase (APT) family kinase protein
MSVVDWELGTLGNPLSDLAYNCLPYYVPDPRRGVIKDLDYANYGILSEADYVALYRERTGRPEIENWPFYIVLSLFRLAAIVQGVYYRGLQGNAPSPEAKERGDMCRDLSHIAWQLVEESGG